MELLIYLLFTIALQGSIKYLLTLREESPYQQTHRWADWFVYYLRRINWFGDNIHSVAAVISWRCAKVAEWLTRMGFVVLWSQVNGRLVSGEIRIIIIVKPKCYWWEYSSRLRVSRIGGRSNLSWIELLYRGIFSRGISVNQKIN